MLLAYIEKFPNLIENGWIMKMLSRMGVCIISIIVGIFLITISRIIITKIFSANAKINPRKSKTLITIFRSMTKYLIYFFVFCQILSAFGVNVTSIIAVASVGSIAIAFGAQSLVQDIITGLFILMEDQFGIGDIITIESLTGTVEDIGIRTTKLRSADGNLYIIPNGQIKMVTNMSKGFNRAVVDVLVNYEEDIDRVISILKDELEKIYKSEKIKGMLKAPEVLGITKLGEGKVELRISADSEIGENWNIEREIRRNIKNRFHKEKISVPYPKSVVKVINDEEV